MTGQTVISQTKSGHIEYRLTQVTVDPTPDDSGMRPWTAVISIVDKLGPEQQYVGKIPAAALGFLVFGQSREIQRGQLHISGRACCDGGQVWKSMLWSR